MRGDHKCAIDATTWCCGVLGHPIHHSASPAFQNAGIEALGLNWRYLAYDVHPDMLPAALRGAQAMKFVGLNLTVPHKRLALEQMDILDASARTWGAVNTVRFEARAGGADWLPITQVPSDAIESLRAHGFNTDADAIIETLRHDLELELPGSSILLVGTGGVGRVAALKLAAEGVGRLHLVNRTMTKAEELGNEIKERYPNVDLRLGYPTDRIDLLINATSLGLKPDDPFPMDTDHFPLKQVRKVFDTIYRPATTALLHEARKQGCQAANGVGMLLHQGVAALRIWSGLNPPVDTMRQALEAHLGSTQ